MEGIDIETVFMGVQLQRQILSNERKANILTAVLIGCCVMMIIVLTAMLVIDRAALPMMAKLMIFTMGISGLSQWRIRVLQDRNLKLLRLK